MTNTTKHDQPVDKFDGYALPQTPNEVEMVEGYAVIVQETYQELAAGKKGLTMPNYETYRQSYLEAQAEEA